MLATDLPAIHENKSVTTASTSRSDGAHAIPDTANAVLALRTKKLRVEIGQYSSAAGVCSVGRSQYPSSEWDHTFSSVCAELQPGVWDFFPALPSWACLRLVHDESYLVWSYLCFDFGSYFQLRSILI